MRRVLSWTVLMVCIRAALAVPAAAATEVPQQPPLASREATTPPKRIWGSRPAYPEHLHGTDAAALVVVEIVVEPDGSVQRPPTVLKNTGDDAFARAVIEAIKSFEFEPARTSTGDPIAVFYTLTTKFEPAEADNQSRTTPVDARAATTPTLETNQPAARILNTAWLLERPEYTAPGITLLDQGTEVRVLRTSDEKFLEVERIQPVGGERHRGYFPRILVNLTGAVAASAPTPASDGRGSVAQTTADLVRSEWVNGQLVHVLSKGGITASLVVYNERYPYLSLAVRNDSAEAFNVDPSLIRCDVTDEKGRTSPKMVFSAEQWEKKLENRETLAAVLGSLSAASAYNSAYNRYYPTPKVSTVSGSYYGANGNHGQVYGTVTTQPSAADYAAAKTLAQAEAARVTQQNLAILSSMRSAAEAQSSWLMRTATLNPGEEYAGTVRLEKGRARAYDITVWLDGLPFSFEVATP